LAVPLTTSSFRIGAQNHNSLGQLERAIDICEQGVSVLPLIELPDLTYSVF
jgi:hypothetical protein